MAVTIPEELPQRPAHPYPAQQQYPVAPQPPKKPMSQGKIAVITVGSCLAGLALFAGLLAIGKSATGSSERDVRMVSCGAAGGQFDIVGAQAEVEVTNKTSRAHSYTVSVSFTDSSGSTQYATGTAIINDVAPGQAGRGTATSFKGGSSGIATCKIARVSQSF